MKQRVRLMGQSAAFTGAFKKNLEDCGFNPVLDTDKIIDAQGAKEVYIIEATDKGALSGINQPAPSSPFLIFTDLDLTVDEISSLKDRGLLGVITKNSAQEDIYFLINKTLFYDKVLKRNPRAQVNIPVELKAGAKVIKSFSSHLSRDGMFIVTINPLAVDSLCGLSFDIPGVKKMTTTARVLYNITINKELNIIANPQDPFKRQVSHPGMAVFFEDLSQEDRKLIDEYINDR